MIKAAVFDLDGTLMDTLTDLHIAVNRALAAFSLPAVTTDKVRASVGNGVSKLIERCLDFEHKNLHRRVLERFNAEYALCKEDNTAPFEGVTDTLSELKRMRIAVAVVSNKTESAVKSLCGDEFGELVDIAVGDDGVRPLKPDPAPVLYALEKLGVSIRDAVYIGDQEVDVITAQNSGIRLIAAGWGFRGERALKDAGAETVISSVRELIPLISAAQQE